jgi:putative phosphoesterase
VRIGLVSDTHGVLDPKLRELFAGCQVILHAGDVVKPSVLSGLGEIAPVTAVRGNNDEGPSFAHLAETALVPVGALTALVVHDLGARERPIPPARAILARRRPEIVIHGHSHRPGTALIDGRLFVNPGSAGPRRFTLPRTAAVLTARGRAVEVVFFDLSGPRLGAFGEPVEAAL